jgi:hypothetical protein
LPAIDAASLRRAVARVAACALLARHWPGVGGRDVAAMALCGWLCRNRDMQWSIGSINSFVALVARIAGDEEWQDRQKAYPTFEKLDAGLPVTGATTLAGLLRDGKRVVAQVGAWLELARATEDASTRTRNEDNVFNEDKASATQQTSLSTLNTSRFADWPDPMGDAAYIGPIGNFVKRLAPETEAAKESLLIQALVMAGNAMGRHGHVTAEADEHHANLYAVVVGGTGARKGTALGQVRRFVKRADEAWVQEHIVNGLSTGEGLINAVRDDEPAIPDKVALAVETEFASVFKVKGRDGNTLSIVLRQAWDGDELQTLTRQSPLKATGTHISIIGHITPDELRRMMSETDANNGFANRILWICANRANFLPDGGNDVNLNTEVEGLRRAIDFAKKQGRMCRDEEAKNLWRKRYRDLTTGRPGLLGAVTNRAEAQVTRLSLLYALLDCSPDIKKKHLEAALAVWDYCLASARFIFGASLGDALAEDLYTELRKHGKAGMSRTEIYQHFNSNKTADEIAQALGMLASQGLAEKRRETGDGGRKVDRWYATEYGNNVFNVNKGEGTASLNQLNTSNTYPPSASEHEWYPRFAELQAAGMSKQDALYLAMAEARDWQVPA